MGKKWKFEKSLINKSKIDIFCSKCKLKFDSSLGLYSHESKCKLTENLIIDLVNDYVIKLLTISDINKKYGCSKNLIKMILGDRVRSVSESLIISKKNKNRKLTEEHKDKIRVSRLNYMKNNPEKTAWRLSNLSYPEKLFLDKIKELELDKKYLIVRERSVFPYFVDFAFENEKIAIEIDGSQHENEDRKNSDIKKDELLNELGWIVIRFSAKKIISDLDECIKIVTSHIIDGLNKPYDVCGVYLYNDIKNIKIIADRFKKCKCGNIIEKKTNMCRVCDAKNQRKVQRPPYEQLLLEVGEIGYVATGKKYGVSDNSIRKWIRMYKKYGENF
jgi:very-short-patch-repair endonuclease